MFWEKKSLRPEFVGKKKVEKNGVGTQGFKTLTFKDLS